MSIKEILRLDGSLLQDRNRKTFLAVGSASRLLVNIRCPRSSRYFTGSVLRRRWIPLEEEWAGHPKIFHKIFNWERSIIIISVLEGAQDP